MHAPPFPSTRWMGSKRSSLPALRAAFGDLSFDSAVDVFSGSAAVSHLLKGLGKQVHANDALASCAEVARALIVNEGTRLPAARAAALFRARRGETYARSVAETWGGLYYLPEEERALDVAAQNVARLDDPLERAVAWYALFQACLKKRPYALFHRANLALRTRDVPRSFGNKASWDRPFPEHFRASLDEAHAAIFASGRRHRVTQKDAFACSLDADLVYLDPPYVGPRGRGFDYADGYHLLEGLVRYDAIARRVDRSRKHVPFVPRAATDLTDPRTAPGALAALLARVPRRAHVVLSYRHGGTPSVEALVATLRALGRSPSVRPGRAGRFALATRDRAEVIVVAPAP